MSKEAMKLALEALENSVDLVREDAYQALKLYGNYPTRQGKVNGLKVLADDHEKAITALREALASEALGKMAENARELGLDYEPAQKPQRWAVFCQGCRKEWSVSYPHPGKDICVDCDDKPAQQEPVCAWQREDDDHMPGTWRSDCGVMWTFTDGSPVDNDMKYCCGCGAMLLEKNT